MAKFDTHCLILRDNYPFCLYSAGIKLVELLICLKLGILINLKCPNETLSHFAC